MLEKMDVSRKMDSKEAKKILEEAAQKLGRLQRECKNENIPILIAFEGMGAAGKGIQINRLIQALDPRGFEVYTSNQSNREERLRPFLWRYWTKTPAKGRIAIFDRSWYRSVQADCFDAEMNGKKEATGKRMEVDYHDIRSFEKQLYDDGTVLIKLFLYIDKKEQKKRFEKLESSKESAWRVSKDDWKRNKEFDRYVKINEQMLEATDTEYAPWTLVEAVDKDYAAVKIISTVCERLEYALSRKKQGQTGGKKQESIPREAFKNDVLSGIDLTKSLTREEYKEQIKKLQKKVEKLHNELYQRRIPVIIGFEGWDAAGKGGAIRRLTSHLDPRGYQVNPTAAPNDIEKKHHYLWRFYVDMPKAGHIAIFDRTWYGRVMVERIEGFCTTEEWQRAYGEINEMERHLTNAGAIVLKFWLHIDKDEQERRFKERMNAPAKQWKITEEDWRNREKWDQYEEAVNEMLIRTSTTYAPWTVVEGNSKYYARVKVLRTVVEAIEARLKED